MCVFNKLCAFSWNKKEAIDVCLSNGILSCNIGVMMSSGKCHLHFSKLLELEFH